MAADLNGARENGLKPVSKGARAVLVAGRVGRRDSRAAHGEGLNGYSYKYAAQNGLLAPADPLGIDDRSHYAARWLGDMISLLIVAVA
jgi:hypothetical protein